MHAPVQWMEGIRTFYGEGYVTEQLQAIEAFYQIAEKLQATGAIETKDKISS